MYAGGMIYFVEMYLLTDEVREYRSSNGSFASCVLAQRRGNDK